MIRIELRQRSSRWRAVGMSALLLVAVTAFAGALYTLDRSGIRWQDWTPQLTSAGDSSAEAPRAAAAEQPAAENTPAVDAWPAANDAPGRAADLLTAVPSVLAVDQLVIDGNGAFTIQGRSTGDLADSLGRLRRIARDVRATIWTSGTAPPQGTITGIVNGTSMSIVPSTRQRAATLLAEAEALATHNGLQQVRLSALRAEVPAEGGLRYRADLSAVGEIPTTRAALRAILDHRVGIVHAALHPVDDGSGRVPTRHRVTLLLDSAVRDEGNP